MRDVLSRDVLVALVALTVVDLAFGLYGEPHGPVRMLAYLAVAALAVGSVSVRAMIQGANRRAVFQRVDERLRTIVPGTDPLSIFAAADDGRAAETRRAISPDDPLELLALGAAWLHLGMGLKSERLVAALRYHATKSGGRTVSDEDLRLAVRALPLTLYEFRSQVPHGKDAVLGLVLEVVFGSIFVAWLYLVGRILLGGLVAAIR